MEVERNNNTRGLAGTALGLGAGALGVQLLNGGLSGLFNGWGNGCGNGYGWGNGYGYGTPVIVSEGDRCVNRYEAEQSATISRLTTEKMLLESNIYTDSKLNDMRNYFERKFDHVEHELCDQRSFNAGIMGKVGCIGDQVAELMGLTKTIIPADSICPPVMPQYNSWTAPTTTTGT